jgi:hypothetical protein
MTFAWYQMLGRTVVTNPGKWAGCWTYPAYKCATAGPAMLVSATEAGYFPMGENTFLLLITLPAAIVIVLIGLCVSCWGGRRARQQLEHKVELVEFQTAAKS